MRLAALLIALGAIIARVWMARITHSTTEDFFITLRYAENIASGRGFVYNPGARVLGTTTPLYTLLLALFSWLHLDAIAWGKTCGILADGLTCWLLARLLARPEIGQPVAGLFAALLYALGSTPISISIGGMETALVTCVGMGMITAYVAGRSWGLFALGSVLFLLRIDGLLLFGILALGLAARERRIPWREASLSLLIALPWLVFAFAYFGSPIPTSLLAKVLVYARIGHTRAYNRQAFLMQFALGGTQRAVTLAFLAGAVGLFFSRLRTSNKTSPRPQEQGRGEVLADALSIRTAENRLALPLLWLLLYYGTMLTSPVLAFAWYFLPPWPLFLGVALLGASWVVQSAARRLPVTATLRLAKFWPAALLALAAAGTYHLKAIRADIAHAQWVESELRLPMGLWFRANARPDERILLEPIGYVGYYSQRPILDMIGLVSPEVFVSYRRSDYLADMVRRFSPAWLCLRPGEEAGIQKYDSIVLPARYDYIREFHLPGGPPAFLLYHLRQNPRP